MKMTISACLRHAAVGMGIVAGLTGGGPGAYAQCGKLEPRPAALMHLPSDAPLFMKSVPEAAGGEAAPRAGNSEPIVGLWKATVTAGGQVVDQAFEMFHDDGTELMVDTAAPASGNVCIGVWAKVGQTYKLNHPFWTFDQNGNLNGAGTIKAVITVAAGGNRFTGSYTVDVFTLSGTKVDHEEGAVAGERITAN